MRIFIYTIILSILFFPTSPHALTLEQTLENPVLEEQAQHIFKEIRCVVCNGQSIADSRAELALDLRKIIRNKLLEGATSKDVIVYITARYGDNVMMQPPLKPTTYFLWFGPAIIIIFAISVIVYNRRKLFG